jgi:glycosyltransferase involved in cell wall biosynthesis
MKHSLSAPAPESGVRKVLQIRSAFEDSGPGTQSLTIGVELRRRGYHVDFAAAGGPLFELIAERGFQTFNIPGLALDRRDPLSTVQTAFQLAEILRGHRYDVIHSHNAASTFISYFASRLAGLRPNIVRSVRGIEVRDTHQWRNWLYRFYPATMLAVSEFTRNELIRVGASPSRILVSYNGVDLARFNPDEHDGTAIRKALHIGEDLIFGHIGAFSGWKGQEVLVDAFASVRHRLPPSHIVFVGDGPARAPVEAQVRRLGLTDTVHFAGFRTDVEQFHAAFDVYCQPSTQGEMLPNAILEAMSMGTPWVGSDISGLSEMTASGRAGLLSAPGDIAGLATQLERLANDRALRATMGAVARKEVEAKFTIQAVVDCLERAYGTSRA